MLNTVYIIYILYDHQTDEVLQLPFSAVVGKKQRIKDILMKKVLI